MGDKSQALEPAAHHIRRGSASVSAAYGADDPRMIGMFNKRGDLAYNLGRFQDADSIYREGLAIVEANYSEDHTRRGDVLWRLGVCRPAARDPPAPAPAPRAATDPPRPAPGDPTPRGVAHAHSHRAARLNPAVPAGADHAARPARTAPERAPVPA